jgi:hypothetical protein
MFPFRARRSRLDDARQSVTGGERPASTVAETAAPPPHTPPTHDPAPSSGTDAARVAERIRSAGMAAPASLLLSILRPAHWLGGQVLYVAQPFLDSLGIGSREGVSSTARLARFLEQEKCVDALLAKLDDVPQERGKIDGPR